MEKIKLSDRLTAVANFVPKGARLADIGSDHAFLPTFLIQTKTIEYAVAGEVVQGPYSIAKQHIREQNLQDYVQVRLADGLSAIENSDQIDTVVIAGMGGILISDILNADPDKLVSVKRLILQPNNHEDTLRLWLNQHQYEIVEEDLQLDAGKFYEIIVAQPTKVKTIPLTQEELRFGPKLSKQKSDVFIKKWEKELQTLENIFLHLPKEQKQRRKEVEQEIKSIKEILS